MTNDEQYRIIGEMVCQRNDLNKKAVCLDKKIDDIKQRLHQIILGIESNVEHSTNEDGGLTLAIKGSTTATLYPTAEEIRSILNEKRDVKESLEKLNESLKKFEI